MSLKRESRRGSTWTLANPFSSKAVIPKELRSIIDEVTGIKKVCMVARSSLLNLMEVPNLPSLNITRTSMERRRSQASIKLVKA